MESQRQNSPPLCANGCGFYGSAATNGLCSKCYAQYLKDHQPETTSPARYDEGSQREKASGHTASAALPSPSPCPSSSSPAVVNVAQRRPRCGKCNKKTGPVAGWFTCRCGLTFCGAHRYPEGHCCRFDYKAAGKAEVAMNNPLVKADKMADRI